MIFTQTFFVLNFGSFLSFLLILHNKSGQGHGSFTGCFLRKNLIWSILIILGFFRSTVRLDLVKIEADHCYCVRYLNGQGMNYFMITTGSLNSQDMMKILKQSRHDFSARHLCDGHSMDIMWCLCVEVNIQQKVGCFCERASLRICYIILFERKGPWMLKTDSLIFSRNIKYFSAQQIWWCCVEKIWLVKNRILSAQWNYLNWSLFLTNFQPITAKLLLTGMCGTENCLYNEHRTIASSICNRGAIRKMLLCNFDCQMAWFHCSCICLWRHIYSGES